MSDAEAVGICLIGIGALLVSLQLLLSGPARGLDGTRMRGVHLRDRLAFSAGLAGAAGVGVGSATVAVAAAPSVKAMVLASLALLALLVLAYAVAPQLAERYTNIPRP